MQLAVVFQRTFTIVVVTLLTILAGSQRLLAQTEQNEKASQRENKEDSKAEQRKKLLERMRKFVDVVEVYEITDKGPVRAQLVEKPLLFFMDLPRDHQNGSLWVWGRNGRPRAIIEVYTSSKVESWPGNVMHSLADRPLRANGKHGWRWSPREPGFISQPVTKAPPPAGKKVVRLRQMKELARRFTAHEYWDPDNQRSELRLLTRPVYRYSDPKSGILDGGIFAFTHGGTNPEAMLLIEAHGEHADEATWHFGFVRLGHAELHAELDGREVWKQSKLRGIPPSSSTYYTVVPIFRERGAK